MNRFSAARSGWAFLKAEAPRRLRSLENAAYVARSVARFVPLYLDGGDPS